MIQSGGFLGRLLGPLLKTGLTLIKNVIKPLAKSVLIPLGLTAAASAADAGIHKRIWTQSSFIHNTIISVTLNTKHFYRKMMQKMCTKSWPQTPF